MELEGTHALFQRLQKENATLRKAAQRAGLAENSTLLTVTRGNKFGVGFVGV